MTAWEQWTTWGDWTWEDNMPDLELPLTGKDWTITLPLEDWSNLIEACKETVLVFRDERLDRILSQALASAQASPPPGVEPEHGVYDAGTDPCDTCSNR